ncbi:MAG TPA: hypothetical protein VGG75_09190 [Trebonia sp.]
MGFIREHLGKPVASTAVLAERTGAFYAEVREFAGKNAVPLVEFRPGQRKDDVMREHLAGFLAEGRTEGVVFIGRAQEKVSVWATTRRRDAEGKSCPRIVRESRVVTQWYFYCHDACAGPFFIKYCGYFPCNAKLCRNGNENVTWDLATKWTGLLPRPVHRRGHRGRLPVRGLGAAGGILPGPGPGQARHRADLLRGSHPRQPRYRPAR